MSEFEIHAEPNRAADRRNRPIGMQSTAIETAERILEEQRINFVENIACPEAYGPAIVGTPNANATVDYPLLPNVRHRVG